jgi:hypothetical protein
MTSSSSGSGNVCLDVYSGEGSAVDNDSITGGFTLDLGPGGGFVPTDYALKCTCFPGSLIRQGYLNGVIEWGPYLYTS